jgi:hypothetical protein
MGSDLLQMHISFEEYKNCYDNQMNKSNDEDQQQQQIEEEQEQEEFNETEKNDTNNTTILKIKSRKSLKLNNLLNENNNNNELKIDENKNDINKKIEELDKKLQILNETSSITSRKKSSNDDIFTPKKSCLTRKTSDLKKRVSFADLHGKELELVKIMTEASDCPPKLTSRIVKYFLDGEYYNDASSSSLSSSSPSSLPSENSELKKLYTNLSIIIYTLNFKQPAGDYLNFQEKIKVNNISLENVIINRFDVTGTIKVNNICFKKSVFVRCTFDCWKTFSDYNATYLPNIYSAIDDRNASQAVDTFKFEFKLPNDINTNNAIKLTIDKFNFKPTHHNSSENNQSNVQFCVCFKSLDDGIEYWDSNYGSNYLILQYLITLDTKNYVKNNCDVVVAATTAAAANKEAELENKLNHINTNYLQLLIQEQNLNTFIDNFFYNSIYNNSCNNNVLNKFNNNNNNKLNLTTNDSFLWNRDIDSGIPYW